MASRPGLWPHLWGGRRAQGTQLERPNGLQLKSSPMFRRYGITSKKIFEIEMPRFKICATCTWAFAALIYCNQKVVINL